MIGDILVMCSRGVTDDEFQSIASDMAIFRRELDVDVRAIRLSNLTGVFATDVHDVEIVFGTYEELFVHLGDSAHVTQIRDIAAHVHSMVIRVLR